MIHTTRLTQLTYAASDARLLVDRHIERRPAMAGEAEMEAWHATLARLTAAAERAQQAARDELTRRGLS